MICRKAPLQSGRETEIDMIERQMEGGVVILQPPEVHEHSVDNKVGGLVEVETDVEAEKMRSTATEPSKD